MASVLSVGPPIIPAMLSCLPVLPVIFHSNHLVLFYFLSQKYFILLLWACVSVSMYAYAGMYLCSYVYAANIAESTQRIF